MGLKLFKWISNLWKNEETERILQEIKQLEKQKHEFEDKVERLEKCQKYFKEKISNRNNFDFNDVLNTFEFIQDPLELDIPSELYDVLANDLHHFGFEKEEKDTLELAHKRGHYTALVCVNLSNYYMKEKSFEGATRILESLLKKEGGLTEKDRRHLKLNNINVYSRLIFAYVELDKEKEAEEVFEEALKNEQVNEYTIFNLSRLYISNNRPDKSIEYFKKGLKYLKRKDNSFSPLSISLAILYHYSGNSEEALKIINKSNNLLDPLLIIPPMKTETPGSWEDLGRLIEEKQRGSEFERWEIISSLLHAEIWAEYGNFDEAIGLLDLTKRYNDSIIGRKIIEYKYYSKFNKTKLKKKTEDEILNMINHNSSIYGLLSLLYESKGDTKKSIEILEEAVSKKQTDSTIFYSLYDKTKNRKYIYSLMDILKKSDNVDFMAYIYLHKLTKETDFVTTPDPHYISRKMIQQMKKMDQFKTHLRLYKKASHSLRNFSRSFDNIAILIKESNSSFDKEIGINKELEDLLGSECILPCPIDSFELDSKFYYIMEREEGDTLTDLIKNDTVPQVVYGQILKIMAKIHVLMPNDLERYNFDKKLGAKVLKAELNESIINSARPMLDVLSKSIHWGYNNDSCSDNWMISSKGKIILLDTEDRGQIPYAVDLAHLLNFVSSEPFEKKLDLVNKYVRYINEVCDQHDLKEKKITDENQFMLEYCNGVIYRSIANYGYLFSKRRPHDSKQVAETGIEMIDYMQRNNMIKQEDLQDYMIIKDTLLKTVN